MSNPFENAELPPQELATGTELVPRQKRAPGLPRMPRKKKQRPTEITSFIDASPDAQLDALIQIVSILSKLSGRQCVAIVSALRKRYRE
jgi:hypothetical protein